MTRQKSIKAQIKRAIELLPIIEIQYNDALNKRKINEDLRLDINAFFGHLRSALDYLAKDIVERYCPNAKKGDRLYFPITDKNTSFVNLIAKSYPALVTNCLDLYTFLESIQPYVKDENSWLTYFNKINNENKHNNLAEQARNETREVIVTGPNGSTFRWGPGIKLEKGSNVMGVPIDIRTQLPIKNDILKTEIITWIDFRFNEIDVSALWLIKESLKQINFINSTITKYL